MPNRFCNYCRAFYDGYEETPCPECDGTDTTAVLDRQDDFDDEDFDDDEE